MRESVGSIESASARERLRGSPRLSVVPLASLALAAIVLLTACSNAGTKVSTTTPASPTTTQIAPPTTAPASTVIIISDLNTFRATLTTAFTSGKWAPIAALLSPAFTFAGTNTGGSHLIMPDAATEFNVLYTANLSWTPQNASLLPLYNCFAGNTPNNQLLLFGGANTVLVMVGIQRWQGYWVLAWAFENTRDSSGYCL